MRPLDLLRSGAFRFAVLISIVFALGTVALLVMVERAVGQYASEVATDSIAAEAAVLHQEDLVTDRSATIRAIVLRENAAREHQLRYLLVDRGGRYVAGSLPATFARPGWRDLTLANHDPSNDDGAPTIALKALGTRLDDGAMLVVAGDTSDLDELRRGLGMWAAGFGIVITLLALIGGLAVGTMFLRRLDRVNRAVERIMHGNLTERLPAIGMSHEFDALSTNLNRLLARIETLMEGLRQVSTDIAHDLRTPLTRLRQRLEAMKDRTAGAVSDDHIDAALAQTDQILTVFRALLRISALEAGAGRQRLVEVDLSALMERLFEAYRPVCEDAGYILRADIVPNQHGRADADVLAQAVTNLIENALFHTPTGSTITLALEQRPDGLAIVVADDGPGIPAAERGNVLKRFYRLDPSRGLPGAGLGLALVAAIASIHRAGLRLSDNHPGLRAEILISDNQKTLGEALRPE